MGVPVTAAVKVTEFPAVMVWEEGWVVKAGATATSVTARVTESEAMPEGATELVATSL